MIKPLTHLVDTSLLRKRLAENILENAHFVFRVFGSGQRFRCYADEEMTVALAISDDTGDVIYAGDWRGIDLPSELPEKDFFVSACPSSAFEQIRARYEILGEWPCWYYLTPDRFEAGCWDELGPLTLDDVPLVAEHWDLTDYPEEHIRKKIAEFDSVCIREGGKPVAWVGLHYEIDGVANMGFAHTLDGYRRRGYAQMVTKAIVNRMADRGIKTTCHVIKENVGSIALCERLGFTRIGEATWADIGKPLD
ncbi:MAG: hypothetical protein AYK23_04170 [Candidatus Proteinoplasmatales archaeon SG8-5]|nr:MAG: hypothetical protein AYK23_04170 [Candidatus Proteinoplasmatales archaeon SG8-5]